MVVEISDQWDFNKICFSNSLMAVNKFTYGPLHVEVYHTMLSKLHYFT